MTEKIKIHYYVNYLINNVWHKSELYPEKGDKVSFDPKEMDGLLKTYQTAREKRGVFRIGTFFGNASVIDALWIESTEEKGWAEYFKSLYDYQLKESETFRKESEFRLKQLNQVIKLKTPLHIKIKEKLFGNKT
jgi:hypothetical protein